MATGDNPVIPLHEPGERPTVAVTAAIAAGKFVRSGGNFQGSTTPLLDTSSPTGPLTGGNLPQVSLCAAAARAWGVLGWDTAAAGDVAPLLAGPGMIVPMVAGAAITANQEVESNASGDPIPLAAGKANGMAISGAASGAPVYVRLY